MKNKPLKPFITDADDLFSFENLEVMKQEIQAISGMHFNKLIRVYRFDGSDKARIHYRIISKDNDGTGVPVRINTSTDPSRPVFQDAFANIAVGFPYYIPSPDGSSQLVYWDGVRNVVVGEFSVRRSLMTTSLFVQNFKGSSGFYPEEVKTSGEPVYIQFIREGKVDSSILPESLKVDNPKAISILIDNTQSTSNSFKIIPQAVETPTTVTITYEGYKAKVIINGGE